MKKNPGLGNSPVKSFNLSSYYSIFLLQNTLLLNNACTHSTMKAVSNNTGYVGLYLVCSHTYHNYLFGDINEFFLSMAV